MSDPSYPSKDAGLSVAERISFAIVATFAATVAGVFALVAVGVEIKPVMLGLLSGLTGAEVGGFGAVYGFWLAGSPGGKKASDALMQIAGASSAQAATAGRPTTSAPTSDASAL